jgi:quinol monooxygenase YgiN
MAVIIAGQIYVDAADRDAYVAAHLDIVTVGRTAPGCVDVTVAADPVDPGRVNMFEHWESAEALEKFRAVAPSPAPEAAGITVRSIDVAKHEIARSGPPF